MDNYKVVSKLTIGEKVNIPYTEEEFKEVPMLFRASREFAISQGNPLINAFIGHLSEPFETSDDITIDCRVHMLMEGWYPCIPGFHHDFVPRGSNGQPDYSYEGAKHALMLLNAEVSPTEFATGTEMFTDPTKHKVVYEAWHKEVESKLKEGKLHSLTAEDSRIYYFDDRTWHRGVMAKKKGWRFFIRASINHGVKPVNEIRNQVQVYMDNPVQGW